MEFAILLVITFLIMVLPVVLYNRFLKGRGGSINPGRLMGERNWRDIHQPPEEEHYR
ncbi:MAG: hypothetical protein U0694_29620 [Anaerolineae bacterium]